MKIGIISDTHNLLRTEVLDILKECDFILHAGDIARKEVLDQLYPIAPVHAVRGNNDKEWAEYLPSYLDMEISGIRIYMTHKKKDLPENLDAYDLVVYGHSHKYDEKKRKKTLILNPGSCGPRRFDQEISLAVLKIGRHTQRLRKYVIPHAPEDKTRTKKTIM